MIGTTSFTVSWSGQDDTGGSGIASFDIFVSDNGGAFTPFLTGTTQTSATFTGQLGHTYGFYGVATDNVGHRQANPASAQATTEVASDPFIPFVSSLYQAVLARTASPVEVDSWVGFLDSGHSRTEVAKDFWESAEHLGIQVDGFYQTYLRRTESPSERAGWVTAMAGGLTQVQVIGFFLSSAEYQSAHQSDASFIDSLYINLLGRVESPQEQANWLGYLQNHTRDQAENFFLHTGEFDKRMVDSYYRTLLQRPADPTGESNAVNFLLGGGTLDAIAEAILASGEFFARH
jgi:hypothetical protein